MKVITKIAAVLSAATILIGFTACGGNGVTPEPEKPSLPVIQKHNMLKAMDYSSGLTEDKTVSFTMNGEEYNFTLNAKTGKVIPVTSNIRAAASGTLDAEFSYYNGRLNLKIDNAPAGSIGGEEASATDPLYITIPVAAEGDAFKADSESLKSCNDSDLGTSANADAKIDFETISYITYQSTNPFELPERVGTNYFAGKEINTRDDEGEKAPERQADVTEDDFWGHDYSYIVVEDNDSYAYGVVYWKNKYNWINETAVKSACETSVSFKAWLETLSAYEMKNTYFDNLIVAEGADRYEKAQAYIRAYYGLSAESTEDEVIAAYLRNLIEKLNRERHIEMQAFWINKANGDMNLIQTTERGLTMKEQFEINNPWPLMSRDMDGYMYLIGGKNVGAPDEGEGKTALHEWYNIVDVTDNTITFVDTNGDLPVRYTIEYTDFLYKTEWTGYFVPNGEGWQKEIDDGVSATFKCPALFGDQQWHYFASGSGMTGTYSLKLN